MAEAPTKEDQALDELLGRLSVPHAPANLENNIMAAIRREEALAAYKRPWYRKASVWACSSAAVLCLCVAVLSWLSPRESSMVAIDDSMVADEVLNNIPDDELFRAICAVSVTEYD